LKDSSDRCLQHRQFFVRGTLQNFAKLLEGWKKKKEKKNQKEKKKVSWQDGLYEVAVST
jgi:hypothetical protein